MQFMISHITGNRHEASNLAAPHTEEDTQMDEAPNENVPESITTSKESYRDTGFLSSEKPRRL
jgi:hypothetical protein